MLWKTKIIGGACNKSNALTKSTPNKEWGGFLIFSMKNERATKMIRIETRRINTVVFIENDKEMDRAEFGVTPDEEMAQKFKKFLLRGASPETEDKDKIAWRTVLTDAARWKYSKTAELLLIFGANPNGMYYKHEEYKKDAFDGYHTEADNKITLLKKGPSPLNLAAENGDTRMCQLLIEYGADIYGDRSSTERPVAIALEHGHVDTAKFLLREIQRQRLNRTGNQRIQEEIERVQKQNQETLQNASENSSDLNEEEHHKPEVVSHSDHSDIFKSIMTNDLFFNVIS